ncbi:D-alanyl-D-alanine carboxypeptidase/D-alanyl-D-alanine-endopeptidase [soil metagenome]
MHLSNRSSLVLTAVLMLAVPVSILSEGSTFATPIEVNALVASPTPTPVATATATQAASPVQTLENLQSQIRQRLFSPAVRRGRVGVKIVSLNSGKVMFEQDSEKYFMPASNMKNFTVATALERLTPEFRFVTSVYAPAAPDSSGVVKSLRIFGRGDVSISPAFFPLDNSDRDPMTGETDANKVYYKALDRLVEKIIAAGVKRIEGSIVGDESYFTGNAIPATWEWDDLQWYYGAEISALQVNDGAVALSVLPGPSEYACSVTINPGNTLIQVINLCTTSGSTRNIKVNKRLDRNVIEITGTMPVGDTGFRGNVTFSRPADLFVALLKQRLEAKGVIVAGGTRLQLAKVTADANQVEIAKLESPPLSEIAGRTMKPSQNMYTETLLWTLGEQVGRKNGQVGDSAQLGIGVVKDFLKQIGVPEDGIVPNDGSGLSRHNLITPAAVTTLYTYMARQSKFSQAWRDSLTIGGVDGTLANRFKGTAAAGNIRGKTGTIGQVSALSGYISTAAGEQLVFSILVNGVPETRVRTSLIDDIVISLANFNGKID